jgi:dihydrodipicolinate synthase/N-acetylneuraminate lyase
MVSSDELVRDGINAFPAATVACFDPTCGVLPRRSLDESRTIKFLERLGELQVPAVLIAASTGHGHLRTTDELEEWFRCAARADLPNTVRTALLRPEDGELANHRLIDRLAELDYPILFVRPGKDLLPSASDREVAENLRPVIAAGARRGLALGVYSIPDVSGLPLTPEATARLIDGPGGDRIVAVKVTEANYERSTLRFLQDPRLSHLKIVQGWDPHLARALQDGPRFDAHGRQRCGVTSGPMSFAVHQYLHLLTAAQRGDWSEVEQSQSAVTTLFQAMQDDPAKFADLQRAKYIMGLGQPLTGTVTRDQVDRVLMALENVPRAADRARLAHSLDLLEDGPFHEPLSRWSSHS